MPYFDVEVFARMLIDGESERDVLNQARKDSPGWNARITGAEGKRIMELEKALIEERALALTWLNDPDKIGNDYEEPFYILAKEELQKEGLI